MPKAKRLCASNVVEPIDLGVILIKYVDLHLADLGGAGGEER